MKIILILSLLALSACNTTLGVALVYKQGEAHNHLTSVELDENLSIKEGKHESNIPNYLN